VSIALAMVTGKTPSVITNSILKTRIKNGWTKEKAWENTEWAYDYEFRPLLKKYMRGTKIVRPKNKTVLDLKGKKGQYIVAIKNHVLLLSDGKAFDIGFTYGCKVQNFDQKNWKIYWYQRLAK